MREEKRGEKYESGSSEDLSWPRGVILMMALCTRGWVPGYELGYHFFEVQIWVLYGGYHKYYIGDFLGVCLGWGRGLCYA